MTIASQTTKAYLQALASKSATPGGGAAAALTAAQGAALLSMVANLSKSDEVDFVDYAKQLSEAVERLVAFADDDARMFDEVMRCMKLPKNDDSRPTALNSALEGAASVPLSVIDASWGLLLKADDYISHANANVITDAGIAVHLLQAAIHSSAYNVRINTKYMKNSDVKRDLESRVAGIEQQVAKQVATLLEMVDVKLR